MFISFSGGETSGYMAALCNLAWRDKWDQVVTVFANTGEENEETLEFVHQCDRRFGLNVVWVEAVVHPGRKASTHRIVNISTASRKGEPYEAVIKKYGIPNRDWPHCTRELKLRPMQSYIESLGWEPGTYETAVGIRADEARRRSSTAKENGIIYPLMDMRATTKKDVNKFWLEQPFRLNLTGYQGNCKWCWKKSEAKLLAIMDEAPEKFDFPERMEALYGTVGAEYRKDDPAKNERRVFFRHHTSTIDLRALYARKKAEGTLEDVVDDSLAIPDFEDQDGCVESCEVNFEEAVLEPTPAEEREKREKTPDYDFMGENEF